MQPMNNKFCVCVLGVATLILGAPKLYSQG
jgi:hypothetical protein